MTDKKFTALLARLGAANNKYKALLKEAEEEFEARYGKNPSDCDCDPWIDNFHVESSSNATAEDVRGWATSYSDLTERPHKKNGAAKADAESDDNIFGNNTKCSIELAGYPSSRLLPKTCWKLVFTNNEVC